MAGKDIVTEASVQFEFYRLLKNNLDEHYSSSIKYVSIQLEYSVKNRAVDLVIDARIGHLILHFLAVEVKKPTMRSFLLFDPKSTQQIEDYAKTLDSVYSVLTDGYVLRLFSKDKALGNYRVELNDDSAKRLLKELLELYDKKRQTLSFPIARSADKDLIAKERDGLVKALIEVLEHLGKEKGFKLKTKETKMNRIRSLTVGSFKNIFSMAIEIEERDLSKDQSYVYLKLSDLRNNLGIEPLHELLVKLRQVPAFDWVDPKAANRRDEFTWKSIKHLAFDREPNFNSMKKQLTHWFFELLGIANTSWA